MSDTARLDDQAEKFTIDPSAVVVSQCLLCRHYAGDNFAAACKAFPSSVPLEILTNDADHRRPFEGDDGVRFEPRPDAPGPVLATLYRNLDALPRA